MRTISAVWKKPNFLKAKKMLRPKKFVCTSRDVIKTRQPGAYNAAHLCPRIQWASKTVDYYIFFIKTAAPRIQNFLSNISAPDTEFPVQHCRSRIQNFLSSIVAPWYRISYPALSPPDTEFSIQHCRPLIQNFLSSISALETKFPMQH